MNEHYIVTVDRGQLRIYVESPVAGHRTPQLRFVEKMDFPHRDEKPDPTASDEANKVTNARSRAPRSDRFPPKRWQVRRSNDVIAAELDNFLQSRPQASWDIAAAPSLYHLIIDQLSPETRRRLKRALSKVMVNLRAEEVRAQFSAAT